MKKVLLVGLIVIVIGAFFLLNKLNPIIISGVETVGSKILQAPVTLSDCSISIFSGEGSLSGLNIGNPKGFSSEYAFDLEHIEVALDVKSVTSDTVHLQKMIIKAPKIIYEGDNLKKLAQNAASYIPAGDEKKTPADDAGAGKKVQIDYVSLEGAQVSVVLPMLAGKPLTLTLPDLELRDIGKDGKTDMAGAMREILAAINTAILPAVQKGMTNIGVKLPDSVKAVEEKAKGGLKSIKGLFGK